MNVDIKYDKDEKKVFAYNNKQIIGECEYVENADIWNIIHTNVDIKYRGQGIAKRLVEELINQSNINHKKLQAECSYAKKILDSNN